MWSAWRTTSTRRDSSIPFVHAAHEGYFQEFFSDREDARLRLKLSIVLALCRAVVKIIAFRCDIEQRSDECFTCNYTSNLVAPKPIIIVSIKCGTERSPFGIVSPQNIDYDFGEVNFSKSRWSAATVEELYLSKVDEQKDQRVLQLISTSSNR